MNRLSFFPEFFALLIMLTVPVMLPARTVQVDFGTLGPQAPHWNEVAPGTTELPLRDTTGEDTGIRLTIQFPFAGQQALALETSPVEGWPSAVASDFLFLNADQSEGSVLLEGLTDGVDYHLGLLSITSDPAERDSRSSWTVNELTTTGQVFNAADHYAGRVDQALEWKVVRSTDGRIVVSGQYLGGTTAGQLNGLVLRDMSEAYDPATFWSAWTFPFEGVSGDLYVDNQHPSASDENPGTLEAPFYSIQAAIDAAGSMDADSGLGIRILVRSGTYREQLVIRDRPNGSPLVIRAEEPGGVVVSGSDIFSDWQETETVGVWEHDWHYAFGWQDNPWPDNLPLEVPGFRSEILFVDGRPYRQALTRADLEDRSYFVDEESGRIYLDPEEGIRPDEAMVEVSVRPGDGNLVLLKEVCNIALIGLRIQHAATPMFNEGAVSVSGSRRILMEAVDIVLNNGYGLEFNPSSGTASEDLTLRGVRMDRNGTIGMTGRVNNLRVADSSCSENNWRGVAVGVNGWAPCGFKIAYCEGVYLSDLQVHNNYATGAWFDSANARVLVERMYSLNNLRHGSSMEANFGPIVIRDSVFAANGGAGINAYDNSFARIEDNLLFNNENQQLKVHGRPTPAYTELPDGPRWWRHRNAAKQIPKWYFLEGNTIGVEGKALALSQLYTFDISGAPPIVDGQPVLGPLRRTWFSNQNTFFHPFGADVTFMFNSLSGDRISFGQYREEMDADADSRWAGVEPPDTVAPALARAGRAPVGLQPVDYQRPVQKPFYEPSLQNDFGFRVSDWFGRLQVFHSPWLAHDEHGWLYLRQQIGSGAVLYDLHLGDIWLDARTWPFLYSYREGYWLYYPGGGRPGNRNFYRLGGSQPGWILVP